MGSIASSSRQTLADIQPGQYWPYLQPAGAGECASGVELEEEENSPTIPPRPRDRQPRTNFRHQPYKRTDRTARQKKGSALLVHRLPVAAGVIDLDAAKAYCMSHQSVTCNFPVNGQPCGQVMTTALGMFMHLKAPLIAKEGAVAGHGTFSSNTQTNVQSSSQCFFPGCPSQVTSSYHRHLMSHFYRYLCPMGGCGKVENRPDQLRKHCRDSHDLSLHTTRRNGKLEGGLLIEDLAIVK